MQRLTVQSTQGAYEVIAEAGSAARLGELLDRESIDRPRSVVTNTTVGPLWGRSAANALAAPVVELPDGEGSKRWSVVEDVVAGWLEQRLHRGDSVAAVGGGVLTDITGFAAAVFMRGIPWVAIPTTLLAMVDASVGGKTGVNLEQGKNLIGSFWPPRLVVVDVQTLTTLPERELRAGTAEVIKTAWIGDRELLGQLRSTSRSPEDWEEIVMRSLTIKARVVSDDEREAGARKALNLGHTLGHALEAATGYGRFLHGEAVAWGLLAAAKLSRRRGLLDREGADELEAAVGSLGRLPAITDIGTEAVGAHIGRDKKRDHTGVGWVLPTGDGVALDQYVETSEALEVFEELKTKID
jgi:3-dehydroquinate synthase